MVGEDEESDQINRMISELQRLMLLPLEEGTQRRVRDLFVFSAFTGLSYADIRALRWENIRTLFDGKTWIATLSLSKGMPIETLSSVMGHTNIRTTQIYAKITNQKISEDMSQLGDKINNLEGPVK